MGSDELASDIAAVMEGEALGDAEDFGLHAASAVQAKEEIETVHMMRGVGETFASPRSASQ
jgi:hypothetical protein